MNAKPLNERELRDVIACTVCGAPATPLLYRVHIVRHGLDLAAVRRADGFGRMLSPAMAMGPDEPMTTVLLDRTVTVCEACSLGALVQIALGGSDD